MVLLLLPFAYVFFRTSFVMFFIIIIFCFFLHGLDCVSGRILLRMLNGFDSNQTKITFPIKNRFGPTLKAETLES